MTASLPPEAHPARAHLLWLTEHYHPGQGGMARSCDRIVTGLRDAGVEVDVVHLTHRVTWPRLTRQRTGRLLEFPRDADPAHTLSCLWNQLERDPARASFTHLVAFGGALPLLAAPSFCAWLKLPLLLLLRGNDLDVGLFDAPRRACLLEALHAATEVCVVSHDKVARLATLVPQTRVSCIHNGIELESWRPLEADRRHAEAFRADSVGDARLVLGLFGQLKRKKGGELLLEALHRSAYAHRFHLLLIGELEPAVRSQLEARADELSFTILPLIERDALLRHYLACDYVALPSHYDGFPNVLAEALALGVPLIASTAGGMGDVLEDPTHAFLFAPGDLPGCVHALRRAARQRPDAHSRQRDACAALAREKLDRPLETARYLELLSRTADQGHRRRNTP